MLPGSIVLDGEYDLDDVGLSVSVKLGSPGVEWDLEEAEREGLDEAAEKLSEQYGKIA